MNKPRSLTVVKRAVILSVLTTIISTVAINLQVTAKESANPPNFRQPRSQVRIAQAKTSLTIAFASRRGVTDLQRKANEVAAVLSKELGIPVTAIVADDTAAVEALRANRVDVAFLSSRPALKAEQLSGALLYLAEVRDDYSGGKTYNSIFVVPKDSSLRPKATPQQTLAQLKGKRIAFVSRTSGSGFIFPVAELVKRKFVDGSDRLENFFSQVIYGENYTGALQAVLRGQADVAAVSEYALLPPWITKEESDRLRVLRAIPNVPAHGIVIDNNLPVEQRESIINAFLKLNEGENNKLFRSLYNSTKLVRVDHNRHLSGIREALIQIGIQP
jgi:phosphonate transport system substrate-binding protein